MNAATKTSDMLVSELAADRDMVELVELYVAQLPAKESRLLQAIDACDFAAVTRYAHQLTRALFYGFPAITAAASQLESSARRHDDPSLLRRQADGVVSLCRRASATPRIVHAPSPSR